MMSSPFSRALATAADTAHMAHTLAPTLGAADVILLSGDVGAGKTHFARALIQTLLNQPEDIPSPTFTLVQTYDTRAGEIWHSDLYRLTSVYEIEELGLTDAFETAICLVEWPDRLGELAPPHALSLTLEATATDSRVLTAQWTDPKWQDKLGAWQT